MATHSSTFAWETPWIEETGGLQFIGSQRVRQDLVTKQQQRGVIRRDEGYMKETRTLILAWRGGDQGLEGLQDAAWGWGSGVWGGHKEARGSEATRTQCRRSQSPTSCWDLESWCVKSCRGNTDGVTQEWGQPEPRVCRWGQGGAPGNPG